MSDLKPKGPKRKRKLTGKQIAFCKHYVSAAVNMNGTEAARRAGYKGNDVTLAAVAYENLLKPQIRADIDKRMAKALSGADVTVENVLRKIGIIGAKSLEAEQYAPAARCAELEGRYLKMFTDKIEHVQDIESASIEELERLLVEIVEAGGLDLVRLFERYGTPGRGGSDNPASKTTH
jgi:phage terminase small subunit